MKVLLLDENKLNRDNLGKLVNENIKDITLFKYITSFSFITGIYDDLKGDVDLALIHIKSNDDERIKMARDIQEYFPHIKIMFYSENIIYAENIFKATPSFFFKIPLENNLVNKALEKVKKDIVYDNNSSIKIVSKGQIIKLKYENINYMESAGRKIYIYSNSGNYETYSTMEEMMQQLPNYFYKCHRSYIVNLYKVTSITKLGLSIQENNLVPFSKKLKNDLKMRLQNI
ncbi:MAG: response regulator transcription factor [Lachnospiraceae bacterium]|nr:response regulator transcription factor [Lachnospiraceae bacterium]